MASYVAQRKENLTPFDRNRTETARSISPVNCVDTRKFREPTDPGSTSSIKSSESILIVRAADDKKGNVVEERSWRKALQQRFWDISVFVQEDRDAGGSASCFEKKASKKGRRSGIERGITGDVGTRHPSPLQHLKCFQRF